MDISLLQQYFLTLQNYNSQNLKSPCPIMRNGYTGNLHLMTAIRAGVSITKQCSRKAYHVIPYHLAMAIAWYQVNHQFIKQGNPGWLRSAQITSLWGHCDGWNLQDWS